MIHSSVLLMHLAWPHSGSSCASHWSPQVSCTSVLGCGRRLVCDLLVLLNIINFVEVDQVVLVRFTTLVGQVPQVGEVLKSGMRYFVLDYGPYVPSEIEIGEEVHQSTLLVFERYQHICFLNILEALWAAALSCSGRWFREISFGLVSETWSEDVCNTAACFVIFVEVLQPSMLRSRLGRVQLFCLRWDVSEPKGGHLGSLASKILSKRTGHWHLVGFFCHDLLSLSILNICGLGSLLDHGIKVVYTCSLEIVRHLVS